MMKHAALFLAAPVVARKVFCDTSTPQLNKTTTTKKVSFLQKNKAVQRDGPNGPGPNGPVMMSGYSEVGCFTNRVSTQTADSTKESKLEIADSDLDGMSVKKCFNHCRKGGNSYFFLRQGKECGCSQFADLAPDTKCNVPCTGNNADLCGGLGTQATTFHMFQCDTDVAAVRTKALTTTKNAVDKWSFLLSHVNAVLHTLRGSLERAPSQAGGLVQGLRDGVNNFKSMESKCQENFAPLEIAYQKLRSLDDPTSQNTATSKVACKTNNDCGETECCYEVLVDFPGGYKFASEIDLCDQFNNGLGCHCVPADQEMPGDPLFWLPGRPKCPKGGSFLQHSSKDDADVVAGKNLNPMDPIVNENAIAAAINAEADTVSFCSPLEDAVEKLRIDFFRKDAGMLDAQVMNDPNFVGFSEAGTKLPYRNPIPTLKQIRAWNKEDPAKYSQVAEDDYKMVKAAHDDFEGANYFLSGKVEKLLVGMDRELDERTCYKAMQVRGAVAANFYHAGHMSLLQMKPPKDANQGPTEVTLCMLMSEVDQMVATPRPNVALGFTAYMNQGKFDAQVRAGKMSWNLSQLFNNKGPI